MKETNFILSGIISRKWMSGNEIDIYMQAFVAKLKKLWEKGV